MLGILALSLAWEFWLEARLGPWIGLDQGDESTSHRWEYVVTSVLFAAIALCVPMAALLRLSAERERIADRHRESEQRFRGIVENSPAGISLEDAEGRYFFINRRFEEITGVASADIRGKTSEEVFPEDFAGSATEHDREVLASGRPSARQEDFRRAGASYSLLTVKFPITDGQGDIAAIGAIHTDITERKHAEKRLRDSISRHQRKSRELRAFSGYLAEARDQAEAASRAKSEFLAMMSHELRTPLNAIIGFSEIIKTETLGPIGNDRYQEFVHDIHASGQHLLELINDILDLSKIESGKAKLYEEDIEIPQVLDAALTLVRESANTAEVELDSHCADGLPMLRADRRKLKQILANVLTNGIKFTPAGGRVSVRVWCNPAGGHVFRITDTGIGIPLDDLPKALAPFQQVDSRLGRAHEGTGLGLPLTKALVELHGGSLDLQSEVGLGTTVSVRFPASRALAPRLVAARTNAS